MSLEQKLTEEQKERILKEVEPERVLELLADLAEEQCHNRDGTQRKITSTKKRGLTYWLQDQFNYWSEEHFKDLVSEEVEREVDDVYFEWPACMVSEEWMQEDRCKISIDSELNGYRFFSEYLDSKYVINPKGELKKEEEIILELKEMVKEPKPDYERLLKILRLGEAKDLAEIVECSTIYSPSYVAVRKLGSGASGTTYKAYSDNLKQFRAVKIIDHKDVNPTEAELLAKLQGQDLENIVQIHEAGDHLVTIAGKPVYAIVMEFLDGKTLDEVIKEKHIPIDLALKYSAQLLNGIKCLRKYGITHRDLNLRNIKITNDQTLKILDFGIATDKPNPLPQDNRRYGSPSSNIADDFFSFALITYQLAIGEHLVEKKLDDEGSETFADRIAHLKEEMYAEKKLKEKYADKIKNYLEGNDFIFSDGDTVKNLNLDDAPDNKLWKRYVPSFLGKIIISSLTGASLDEVVVQYKQCGCGHYLMNRDDLIEEVSRLEKSKWKIYEAEMKRLKHSNDADYAPRFANSGSSILDILHEEFIRNKL